MAIRSKSAASAPEHHPTQSGMPKEMQSISPNQRSRPSTRPKMRRRLRSFVLAGSAAIVLSGSTGCSMLSNAYKQISKMECVDEFMIAHRNRVFAERAWIREKHCHRNESNLDEFKAGFIEGYLDIATGGNGCCPCLAPSQFWGWKYQSPGGQAAMNAWFAGFPLGVKAAEQDGLGNWSQLRTMGTPTTPTAGTDPAGTATNGTTALGPDGRPMRKEIIVPGSERIVPTPFNAEPMDLEPPMELLNPPTPSVIDMGTDAGELLKPNLGDETSIDVPTSDLVVESELVLSQAESNDAIEPLSESADLVPRQSAQIYSLNDLGDDAIEGIFGSVELPGDSDVVSRDLPATRANSAPSQDSESVAETASAYDEDISFKFE